MENEEDIFSLSRTFELSPENAEAYLSRGLLCSQQRNHEKALSDFDRAIELVTKGEAG